MADGNANFLVQVNGQDNTRAAFDSVLASAERMGAAFGVGFGLNALKNEIKDVVGAFGEQQAAQQQTAAVLQSTGGIAGVTAQQVGELADKYSSLTQYSDNTVQSAENLLLTFTNIGKDVFPQATETVLNMAQALGEDTKSSAIQLGKAMQDPILGATALRRVGVNLNDTQMEQIKAFTNSGQVMKAQGIVMTELNKEFGNSAIMYGQTLPGQLAILGNQFDKVKENIGGLLGGALAPLLTSVLQFVSHNQDLVAAMAIAGVAAVALTGAVYGLAVGIGALTAAMIPGILIFGGLAAIIGVGVFKAVQNVQAKMKELTGSTADNGKAVKDAADKTAVFTKAQQDLAAKLADIKKQIEDENSTFQESLAEMIRSHQDKVATLSRQLKQENDDFTANEADKLQKFNQTVDQMELSHSRFLEDNKKAVDDENEHYAKASQQKLDDFTKKINLEKQAGTEVSQLKVKDLQDQLAQELGDLQESHNDKLASLQTALGRENQDYTTHFSQTQQQYQDDTQKAKDQHDQKVTDTSSQLSTEQSLLAAHQAEVDATRDFAFRDEIAKLEAAHQKTLDSYAEQAEKAKKTAQGTVDDWNTANSLNAANAGTAGTAIGKAMADSFRQAFKDGISQTFSDFWNSLVQPLKDSATWLKGAFGNGAQDVINSLHSPTPAGNYGGAGATIGQRATGGPFSPGEWSWVGEKGPELVRFGSSGQVYDSQSSMSMAGGGAVNVYIQGDLNVDSEQRKDALIREIAFLLGRQGSLATNGVI